MICRLRLPALALALTLLVARRDLCAAAVVTYPAAPSPRTVQHNLRPVQLPLRGIGMQIHRGDAIADYKKCIDKIAGVGADTVLLVVNGRMNNAADTVVRQEVPGAPTADQLGELIDYAKAERLRVVLMPIVLLDHPRFETEWRGTLKPEDWSQWWNSYRAFLYHYCVIAEKHGVDLLSVGSELVSTESQADQWQKTIALVRQNFKGMLTYSSNWDHYVNIPFWEQLDLVSMNSYWTLGESKEGKVSLREIELRWVKIKRELSSFLDRVHKPLLFMEVGWCSLANAAKEPWDYTQESVPVDLDLQRKLYQGFFDMWYGNPQLGGFMIWEWTAQPAERGYSPEGKPAERVLKDWMAQKPWIVK